MKIFEQCGFEQEISTLPKTRPKSSSNTLISIVTPAFNEAKNLPLLYTRLKISLNKLHLRWEWIVVDDHSIDRTYRIMESIARKDKRVKLIRFAKNLGSHLALACALREAKGDCAIGIAADMQDPPELVSNLMIQWNKGDQVVWAVRSDRKGESFSTILFARLYYFIVRYGFGMRQVPPTGADFFLLDRVVLNALARSSVKNISLFLLISSLGFRKGIISYIKQKRAHGKSGWTLRKKLVLFIDSILMFPKTLIYWILVAGFLLFALGSAIFFFFSWELSLKCYRWVLVALGFPPLVMGFILWKISGKPFQGSPYVIEKTTIPRLRT